MFKINLLNQENYTLPKFKQALDELTKNLSADKKALYSEIMNGLDKKLAILFPNLSEEQRIKYETEAIKKYFLTVKLGNQDIHGHIEALHGATPVSHEIVEALKFKYPNLKEKDIFKLITEFEDALTLIQTKNPEITIGEASKILKEQKHNEYFEYLITLKNKLDEKTDQVAKSASQLCNSSLIIPRKSRVYSDLNRDALIKRSSEELTENRYIRISKEIYWQTLALILNNAKVLNQEKMLTKPYLLLSVHGKANEGHDFAIANAIRKGKTFCDPAIADWFKKKLELKLKERGITKSDGSTDIYLSREGEKYNGAPQLYNYRYGDKKHPGYGDDLQIIQIEIGSDLRKKFAKELGEIFAEIMTDFTNEFKDENDLNTFNKTNTKIEDEDRLRGTYTFATLTDKTISAGQIGIPSSIQKALGLESGTVIDIDGKAYKITAPQDDTIGKRLVYFSPDEDDAPIVAKVNTKV